jgi:hypothetical protein
LGQKDELERQVGRVVAGATGLGLVVSEVGLGVIGVLRRVRQVVGPWG